MDERAKQGQELYELGLRLGMLGPIAIGAAGGTLAVTLARCVACGVAMAGNEARFHDGSCAACGIWLTNYYRMPGSVFIRQTGCDVNIRVADREGAPLSPPKAERVLPCTGSWDFLAGADNGWAARRASGCTWSGAVVAEGPPALSLLLERMGCDVLDRAGPGVPRLRSDEEGFLLTVEWEGRTANPPGEDALAAAARWLSQGRAIPAFKPTQI